MFMYTRTMPDRRLPITGATLCTLVSLSLPLLPAIPAAAACLDPPGDVDGNGVTLVVDVQCTILMNLWSLDGQTGTVPSCIAKVGSPTVTADHNCDGVLNVTDTLLSVTFALKQELSPSVDSNSNQCVDTCETNIDGDCDFDFTDCAPLDANVSKCAVELCNGYDDNCNGLIDEPTAASVADSCEDTDACNGSETCKSFPAGLGLRITEIHAYPVAVSGKLGAWFEIWNPGTKAINLMGWHLVDATGKTHTIDPGGALFVAAGGFLVVGNNKYPAANGGVHINYEWTDLDLGQAEGSIKLVDPTFKVVDDVAYGPGWPIKPGASMAVVDGTKSNDSSAAWTTSKIPYGAGDLGTPGGPNDDVYLETCVPGVAVNCLVDAQCGEPAFVDIPPSGPLTSPWEASITPGCTGDGQKPNVGFTELNGEAAAEAWGFRAWTCPFQSEKAVMVTSAAPGVGNFYGMDAEVMIDVEGHVRWGCDVPECGLGAKKLFYAITDGKTDVNYFVPPLVNGDPPYAFMYNEPPEVRRRTWKFLFSAANSNVRIWVENVEIEDSPLDLSGLSGRWSFKWTAEGRNKPNWYNANAIIRIYDYVITCPDESCLDGNCNPPPTDVCADGISLVQTPWGPGPAPGWSGRSHVATAVLPNGTVFVNGGQQKMESSCSNQTRILDPGTDTWTSMSSSSWNRCNANAVALSDGSVIVSGNEWGIFAESERWFPDNHWETIGNGPDANSKALRLADGRVIAVGGGAQDNWTSAYPTTKIYDPASPAAWQTKKPMNQARYTFGMALLQDGRIMVAGGTGPVDQWMESAEIYDPAKDTWTLVAPMKYGRLGGHLALLPSGKVLAFGGAPEGCDCAWKQSEVFDPATNTWTDVGPMALGRVGGSPFVTLPSGLVLVVGGQYGGWTSTTQAEYFDEADNAWHPASSLVHPRTAHGLVFTAGELYAIQGIDSANGSPGSGSFLSDVEKVSCPKAAAIPTTCASLLLDGVTTDGIYVVDPDGSGPTAPMDVYCDMTTDGGGFTLVATWNYLLFGDSWGTSSSPSTTPTLTAPYWLPFAELFPAPEDVLIRYEPTGSKVTRSLSPGDSWSFSGNGASFPTQDGNHLIFGDSETGRYGICITNGQYQNGFTCDGDDMQSYGIGLFEGQAGNEICNCGFQVANGIWKPVAGGSCTSGTLCDAKGYVNVFLR